MLRQFCELAKIPSLSGREGALARRLAALLRRMGAEVAVDGAGRATGGETGNLIARFAGTGPGAPLLLSAHMDTVGPASGVKPVLGRGRVSSDGTTVLGADCKSGIVVILEAVLALDEAGIPRPPVEAVFTVSEETALLGAKFLDYSLLKARAGLIFDSERPLEEVVTSAPAADRMDIRVYGAASHSGTAPEKGISAIKVVSDAISGMRLGRIDAETTANIGVISGGEAVNVVPPLVELSGEARSHDPAKLRRQTRHMEDCLRRAVRRVKVRDGKKLILPRYEFALERKYPNLRIPAGSAVLPALGAALRDEGLRMRAVPGGGGTDGNIFYGKGITAPVLGTGMRQVHTTREHLLLKDFFACARVAARALAGWSSRGAGN